MLKVINPFTEKKIVSLKADTAKTVHKKFIQARKKQKKWQNTSLSKRIDCLSKWNGLLKKHQKTLAKVLTNEMGKPITQSMGELQAITSRVDFFLNHVSESLKTKVLSEAKRTTQEEISYDPLGVIANISAWNYPYFVGGNVFVPALLMGNAVLFKSSEYTAVTGNWIAKLLHEAGVPESVFVPIVGDGQVGAELLKEDVDAVFFTGSYKTGLKILDSARGKIIPVQLELGGKDPAYVCADAEIKNAAHSTAEGVFFNTGQSCCSIERLYVHEKIYDKFMKEFIKTVKQYVMGDPKKPETFLGPLTRKEQPDFLRSQVKDALSKKGKLLLGGKKVKGKGYFFEPTVIANANHKMLLMTEESFGPIIGIQKVKSDAEALELMQDTEYGLTAAVFTQSETKARKLLGQIETGTAYWNCCDRTSANLPWSGRKHSGVGVTMSLESLSHFVKPRAWHMRTIMENHKR